MTDYQIQVNTRRCAVSGKELQPGERFYSVLLDEGGKFQRLDYSTEAWQGPPKEAFSFWAGRIPLREDNRRPRIDDDLLMDCFERLEEEESEASRSKFRYVVALLLMRRKRLKFAESRLENGIEVLHLHGVRTGKDYRVINPRLTEDEMAAVQEEVFRVLGWQ